jgi:hypothetical protein
MEALPPRRRAVTGAGSDGPRGSPAQSGQISRDFVYDPCGLLPPASGETQDRQRRNGGCPWLLAEA